MKKKAKTDSDNNIWWHEYIILYMLYIMLRQLLFLSGIFTFCFIFCEYALGNEVGKENGKEEQEKQQEETEEEETIINVSDLSDTDDQTLYSAIFGTVAQEKEILLEYDVLIDGEKVGSAPVFVQKNNGRIQVAALKSLLLGGGGILDPEDIDPIDKKMDKEGFISFDELTRMAFKTRINRLTLCVEISLPIEKKKIRSLSSFSKHREAPNAFPANISGFCSIWTSETLYRYKNSGNYNVKNLVLNPTVNFWGLCVEGQTSYMKASNSKEKGKFVRDYTTAVYDFPNHDITVKYGDVFSHSLSYQSVPHVWGFNFHKGVERTKQEGWDRNIQIALLKKSTIEVYSNGHLIRTKNDIAPGTYVFDDISFHNGDNDIKIKIIDDTGKETILDESCFYESSYVPRGEFTSSFTYGYPQTNQKHEGRYDKKHPIWSGNIRYGLLSSVELGFGILKNNIGNTMSYEIKNKNILGSFDIKLASSLYKKAENSIKGKVFYSSYNTPSITFDLVSIGFSGSYESSDNFFKPYLADTENNVTSFNEFFKTEKNEKGKNKTITYGIWLSNLFTLNFNFSGSIKKRYDDAKSRNYSFNVSRGFNLKNDWFNRGSISATFEREYDYEGNSKRSLSLYFSIFLENKISVSSGMSKNDNTMSKYVTMSYYPQNTGFGGEITASQSGPKNAWSAHANYSHHLFKGNLSHSRDNDGENSTNIGFETGIFFADTRYGISRPLYSDGGFVIATPKKALENTTLKFTSPKEAESGFLGGGAVIPNSKNSVSIARLDLKELPMGVDVKKDTIVSYGEYKRGFIADIEAEGSYTADGYLFDESEEPFQHATGYAIHKTDLAARPIAFFTNDEGRFVLTELKQGKYKISLNVEDVQDFEIEIKENSDEIIHLGRFFCK